MISVRFVLQITYHVSNLLTHILSAFTNDDMISSSLLMFYEKQTKHNITLLPAAISIFRGFPGRGLVPLMMINKKILPWGFPLICIQLEALE